MQKIDEFINKYLIDLDYEPILTMLSNLNSGKKLRSKLILAIAGQSNEAYKLCACVELIHLASLLHDDIIDESILRRGARSVNAQFGTKNALMLGDILYSKAFFELSKTKFSSIISEAVANLAIGELMDVNLSSEFNENKEQYLKMIYYKTAVLIEASARCGAILAGFDELKFAMYGKNLGLAFQMIDDILDIKSDEKTLGKPAFSDFKEGKTTLPYIYLYENLSENDKAKLKSLFKKELNESEKEWIKDKFQSTNSLQKAVLEAKNYANLALSSIDKFENLKLNEIANSMINREF